MSPRALQPAFLASLHSAKCQKQHFPSVEVKTNDIAGINISKSEVSSVFSIHQMC